MDTDTFVINTIKVAPVDNTITVSAPIDVAILGTLSTANLRTLLYNDNKRLIQLNAEQLELQAQKANTELLHSDSISRRLYAGTKVQTSTNSLGTIPPELQPIIGGPVAPVQTTDYSKRAANHEFRITDTALTTLNQRITDNQIEINKLRARIDQETTLLAMDEAQRNQ